MEQTSAQIFGIWIAAFLTIGIISFLYKDNILYKICESIFVGISAGYWFITYFWDNLYKKFWLGVNPPLPSNPADPITEPNLWLWGGVILGVMMLTRLLGNKTSWIARWPLAFIVGATAGLKLMVYFTTDAMAQIYSTVIEFTAALYGGDFWTIWGALVIATGTVTGLIYFYFSKEHRGWFGGAAKIGTWFLMITFGASFGYTVMSRMSLLIGRVDFLLADWLKLIK
ncbi:MAG: hypothetical protein WBP29_03615 [Candidatus Zixiibacteriota bacterium]